MGQVEDALESPDRIGGGRPVDAVRGDGGDGRVIPGDAVQLVLELPHLFAGGAYIQIVPGPGRGNSRYDSRRIDVHIVPVIITNDINGGISFFPQVHRAPLAQARAGDPPPIAVRSEDRLPHPGAGQVIGENRVHKIVDILKDISPVHPLLVICGGRGDGEIVSLVPIPWSR